MFDPNIDEKPVGKCRKCGIDLYRQKDKRKLTECPNCGPLAYKDINHYLYPQNAFDQFTQD